MPPTLTLNTSRGTYTLQRISRGVQVTERTLLSASAALSKQLQRPTQAMRLLSGLPPQPEYAQQRRVLTSQRDVQQYFRRVPLSLMDRQRLDSFLESLP